MPRNFVIIYAAREGSSSIIGELSRHPDIVVPVFEEFDAHWIAKFFPDLDLGAAMDTAFRSGLFEREEVYGRKNFVAYDAERVRGRDRSEFSVGFKWRPHGSHKRSTALFAAHEVLVFHLIRRDFRELICSLYLSQQSIDGKAIGHAQFAIASGSQEGQKVADQLRDMKVAARFWPMLVLMIKRVGRAWMHARFLNSARRAGLTVRTLCYEDYLTDPKGFLSDICLKIGVAPDAPLAGDVAKPLQKATTRLASDRVSGLDRWATRAALQVFGRVYEGLNREA